MSTPNILIASPFRKTPLNHYHKIEFDHNGLKNEVERYFNIEQWLCQRPVKKIFTRFVIMKIVLQVQKIISILFGKNFNLYNEFPSPEVKNYNPKKYVPRIFFLVLKKSDR